MGLVLVSQGVDTEKLKEMQKLGWLPLCYKIHEYQKPQKKFFSTTLGLDVERLLDTVGPAYGNACVVVTNSEFAGGGWFHLRSSMSVISTLEVEKEFSTKNPMSILLLFLLKRAVMQDLSCAKEQCLTSSDYSENALSIFLFRLLPKASC